MTIAFRNTVLIFGILIGLIIALLFSYTLYRILTEYGEFFWSDVGAVKNAAVSAAFILVSLIAGIVLKSYFKKSTSVEIFFFILFVLSLSFEALRVELLLLELTNQPAYFGAIITRIVLFGRIFRILCLFTAGLFATGFTYQKYELFIGLAILIAFTLAGTVAVDTSKMLNELIYDVGNRVEVRVVLIGLSIATVFNFVLGGILHNNRDYLFVSGGAACTVAGLELLSHSLELYLIIPGFVLLIGGIFLYSNRVHALYMWGG
jgi:hypothetical protein